MNNDRRRDWRELESTADAVRRLTAIIDERNAKKRASGAQRPDKIQDRQKSPAEKWPEPSDKVGNIAPGSGQSTQPWEEGCDHTAGSGENGSGLVADGVMCVGSTEPDEMTMRPSAPGADSNRHDFTTGVEVRAVRRVEK